MLKSSNYTNLHVCKVSYYNILLVFNGYDYVTSCLYVYESVLQLSCPKIIMVLTSIRNLYLNRDTLSSAYLD